MKQYLIAKRYAKALSLAIEDDAALESTLGWLNDFSEQLRENTELQIALTNPAIPVEQRHAALTALMDASNADAIGRQLLETLMRRGRIAFVEYIAEVFGEFVDERLNRVTAMVTSASELNEAEVDKIREGLAKYSSKKVRIVTDTDPSIIGGVVANIDGQVIDGSLRARLAQLRTALLAEENETA